jgi:hypothetical protein
LHECSRFNLKWRNIWSEACSSISFSVLQRRFGWLDCQHMLLPIIILWLWCYFYSKWLLWGIFISALLMKLTQFVYFLASISSSIYRKFWCICIMFILHHGWWILLDFIVIRLIFLILKLNRFFKWTFIDNIIMQFLFRFFKFFWRIITII